MPYLGEQEAAREEQRRVEEAAREEQRRVDQENLTALFAKQSKEIAVLTHAISTSKIARDTSIMSADHANDKGVDSPQLVISKGDDRSTVSDICSIDTFSALDSLSRPSTATQTRRSTRIKKKDESLRDLEILEKENMNLKIENRYLLEKEAARTRPPKDANAVTPARTSLCRKTKLSVIEHQDRQAQGRLNAERDRAARGIKPIPN
jgi:hypothetical protein